MGVSNGVGVGYRGTDPRSVSPVVGLLLLFGMVLVGAALVGAAGVVLVDGLESGSVAERTQTCTEEADHRIATVLSHGAEGTLPCDGGTYVPDGKIYLVWHDDDGSSDNLFADYGETTVRVDPIGAIEYRANGQAYAYQSGGTWERTEDGTRVLSNPTLAYDGTLQWDLVTIDERSATDRPTRISDGPSRQVSADVEVAMDEARSRGYRNLTIVIESDYHVGWARHLNESFEGESVSISTSNVQVPHVDEDRSVQVTIADAIDSEPPFYAVREDVGLYGTMVGSGPNVLIDDPGAGSGPNPQTGPGGPTGRWPADCPGPGQNNGNGHGGNPGQNNGNDADAGSQSGQDGNRLRVCAQIENVGDETGGSQRVEFDVLDAGVPLDQTETTEPLGPGERQSVGFSFNYGTYSNELEHGRTYEYAIRTENDSLDRDGRFYFAKQPDSYLVVSNPRVDGGDASDSTAPVVADRQNVTISADVHNIGATNITDGEIELSVTAPDVTDEADPYGLGSEGDWNVSRTYAENDTASWELNRSALLEAKHEFTISVADTHGSDGTVTGYFTVEDGVDVGETELVMDPGTSVNVTVAGTEMSDADRGGRDGYHTVGYEITNKPAGLFTTDEDGMTYEFTAEDPDSADDELPTSSDGGWVAPDGTEPEPEGYWDEECPLWWCEDVWKGTGWSWDTDELVWNPDEGYELSWEVSHDGVWGWNGPTGETIVPAGNSDEIVGEPIDTVPRYTIDWLPGSATLITQPVDEDNNAIGDPELIDDVEWHGQNLNVEKDTTRPLFEHSFYTEERVSFQMEASSHNHGGSGWCGSNPTEVRYDLVDDTVYENEYCPGSGAVAGNSLVDLEANTDTEATNVRVLQDGDQMPTIESGSEWQRDVDELLERDGVDVSVGPDGTLQLNETEFVFVFELTHHPRQYNTNPRVDDDISASEYWDLAYSSEGDPNFNDMIVHVDIDPPGVPADFAFDGAFYDGTDGGGIGIGPGNSTDEEESPGTDSGIEVGSDELIIG